MAPLFTANWFNFGRNPAAAAAPKIQATGGSVLTPGNGYRYHVFKYPNSDSFALTEAGPGDDKFDILVIGGGGGGGGGANNSWYVGGGGGAGGLAIATNYPLNTGTTSIQVGDGGAPGNASPNNAPDGSNGEPSYFGPSTIVGDGGGGGGGGSPTSPHHGKPGGSGGCGGSGPDSNPGTANQPGNHPSPLISDHGGDGGRQLSAQGGAGGGGGADGAGQSTPYPTNSPSGAGGPGRAIPQFPGPILAPAFPTAPTWASVVGPTGVYAGGGGGGSGEPSNAGAGDGGPGGGAPGGPSDNNATVTGLIGTGGGGGGGGGYNDNGNLGSKGGSGIVAVRYPYVA